jgi:hypothetical protein
MINSKWIAEPTHMPLTMKLHRLMQDNIWLLEHHQMLGNLATTCNMDLELA